MKKLAARLAMFLGVFTLALSPVLAVATYAATTHAWLVSGTATEITSTSLKLTRGNKVYTVNVSSSATVVDNDWQDISLNEIHTGDRVFVFGKVNDVTIEAIYVKDRSVPVKIDVREMSGTASSVSSASFSLKRGSKTSTINIGSHTMLFDKNWGNISLSDIKDGHRVTVYGRTTDNGATVNAVYVKDKDLPAS
ncbi:MAG: DUF5666 domain-containing protein [bacterium]